MLIRWHLWDCQSEFKRDEKGPTVSKFLSISEAKNINNESVVESLTHVNGARIGVLV